MNDIDDLNVNNDQLYENIRKILLSNKDKLKISFIGKVSTPTNLFIKHLTDIDFSLNRIGKINRYFAVISKWRKINMDQSCISDYGTYNMIMEKSINSKDTCGIFRTNWEAIFPIKTIGSTLNDIGEDYKKYEIYLPIKSKESVLKKCIIYNPPPIGYSDKLDEFIVKECYESCYLYVFFINAEESILEKEMKILKLLMDKRKFIEVKFVIACSDDLSMENYSKIEQHYNIKTKEINAKFPGIIINSGHIYISYKKIESNESNSTNYAKIGNFGKEILSKLNTSSVPPLKNRIKDLENFILEKPTKDMIWAAVKSYKLKTNPLIKSTFLERNGSYESGLQNSVKNIEKIINFVSKSVNSKELKDKMFHFNIAMRSILLDKKFGSNYVIFGNPLITSLDILQALIGQHISHDENLNKKLSIIKCNFNPINHEYFVLQNDKESEHKTHDICELNHLSKLISNSKINSDENISIELHLDNETHPVIKDKMKIIYYNDFDINNEKLLNEFDKIAVILDYKSDNNNKDIVKHCQSKHVQIYIEIKHDEKKSNDMLETEIGDVIHGSDFNFIFYKIMANFENRKIANEIILLVENFLSNLDKEIYFDVKVKDISDWQFQQLDDSINSKIKSTKNNSKESINILKTANKEIIEFVKKIFMENMNISDKILFPGNLVIDSFEDTEIKECDFSKKDDFLNYYATNRTNLMRKINETYTVNTRKILNDREYYKKVLNAIIDHLKIKYCKPKIVWRYKSIQ